MAEEIVNNETALNDASNSDELIGAGMENAEKTGGDSKPRTNIKDMLTKKAARFFNESGYSEKEYISMLNMYDKTMKTFELGNIVTGTILKVTDDSVIVDIGFKSEGIISLHEFNENTDIQLGDKVEVILDDFENQDGQMVLSKQRADFMRVWDKIKEIYENDEKIEGRMLRRIKGGIVVNLLGVDAFLPGSQIDIRQVKDFDQYIGLTTKLKIIKLNKARRNIVVSRRAVLEEERARMREDVLAELEIGQTREGTVKNITDFGAFIDLGGVDGLLHITDMSWGRISHPSELLSIGDKIKVKVLNFEEGKTRISLGMKQLTPYPWEGVEERYPKDSVVTGRVVSTTDYGVFVELERGIEGLVHISEMSWTQPPKHPSKIFNIGDEIKCMVLNVDKEGEKISLGIKQLKPNPWATIDERHPVGTRIIGKVRNLTNFGAFVEIEEGIDGLVHISDMSWTRRIKHPSEVMKKGENVEVVILDTDKGNRRISLGHKQIFDDPWETLEERFALGMITKGTIIRLLDRGVVVALENDIEGFVPSFQLSDEIKKPADVFQVGDEVPLKVIEFGKEQRKIILSVREYFKERDKAELEEFKQKYKPKPVTIGDAFGSVLEDVEEKEAVSQKAVDDDSEITSKKSEKIESEKTEEDSVTGKDAEKSSAPFQGEEEPASKAVSSGEEISEETAQIKVPTQDEKGEVKSSETTSLSGEGKIAVDESASKKDEPVKMKTDAEVPEETLKDKDSVSEEASDNTISSSPQDAQDDISEAGLEENNK